MIAVVDYGLGNLGSVANMLKKIGAPAKITSDEGEIRGARGLILPGVGHFDEGMRKLHERGLTQLLEERVKQARVPILGICLGMQLLARRSEEGREKGLGWLAADVKRFAFAADSMLPIPHMGWNEVDAASGALFAETPNGAPRFYFVHSYHVVCDDAVDVMAWSTYGYRFAAAVRVGEIYGVQFHPEKSHKFGMVVLKNFAAVVANAA